MSNQVSVDLEWKMNASAIVFTTVFGTVRRYWEEVICQAFGIDIDSDEGAQICGSFAIKEFNAECNFVKVNTSYMGDVEISTEVIGEVEVNRRQQRLGLVTFSEIINA